MKRLLIAALALVCMVGATAQTKKNMNAKKVLIAYFSCTGTTKAAAEKLAQTIGADLYEIKPETPYTAADLNWKDKNSRSSKEMNDTTSRPAISGKVANMKKYNTVFVGFPVWWNLAPTIVNTFLESYDFNGKKVIPFITSGSSSIANSEKTLRKTYPHIEWKPGMRLNGQIGTDALSDWLDKVLK